MYETIFALVFLVEAVIESIKMMVEEFSWEMGLAFVLGGGGSYLFGVNLFEILEVELVFNGLVAAILSSVLLGLFFVRFSGAANSLIDFLKSLNPGS